MNDTLEEAATARKNAEILYWGEFAPKERIYEGPDLFA